MPRKTTIPIYDGDDFERMAELRREVMIAERKLEAVKTEALADSETRRAGDEVPAAERKAREALESAQNAFDTFVDEASERAEMWVLEPIGHEEWRALLKAHEPRKIKGEDGKESTHPEDNGFEVNTETFPKALLLYVDPEDDEIRTVAEPKFETEAQFRRRVKRLAVGEFESLWIAAYQLNSGGIADPKLLRFSPAALRSSET